MQLFSSWTGSDFLLFYIGLLCFCGFAAWLMPHLLRPDGRGGAEPDVEGLALLVGGTQRLSDSVVADLFARGGLEQGRQGTLVVTDPELTATAAGQALLALREPFTPLRAQGLLGVQSQRIAARLQREGLMLRPEELAKLRVLAIAPFVALFMIGLYRQRAGAALGEPTGLLLILLGITVLLAAFRFFRFDRRTRAGLAAVAEAKHETGRLRLAPQSGEAALAVALFGTAVLVGTPWEQVHAMRAQSDSSGGSSSSGSSDSGSDSGSDGGGGGCGGCGG